MKSILIHTTNRGQTKVFEQMAKVMNLSYKKDDNSVFQDNFKNEFAAAIDIEIAEEKVIKNLKKAWKKSR